MPCGAGGVVLGVGSWTCRRKKRETGSSAIVGHCASVPEMPFHSFFFVLIISCSKFCVKDSAPHEKVKKKSFHSLFLVHFVMRNFNAPLLLACAFAIAGFFRIWVDF